MLITGDLVNSGERIGHEGFKRLLGKLTAAGKKVYVTTATHDYNGQGRDENFFSATYYGKHSTSKAEGVYKDELLSLYYDFGPASASSVHESGSYSVEIQKGYRLIAINDNGNGRSHCGLFDDGFKWLEDEIVKAKANSETVFLAVHHPVVPPWEVYEKLVEFEMFGGYRRLRELMCKYDIKVIFTGHTHIHGIKKYENAEGKSFYDVTTTSLVAARGKMRKVVFDKDNNTCDITSVEIDTIKGADLKGKSAYEYRYSLNFVGLLESLLPLAGKNWEEFLQKAGSVLPVHKIYKQKKILVRLSKAFAKLKLPSLSKFVEKFNKAKPMKIVKFVFKRLMKIKMLTVARFAGKYCKLTKEDKKALRGQVAIEPLFDMLEHIIPGNPPLTQNDPVYKVFYGVCLRADALLKLVGKDVSFVIKGMHSVAELADPFLRNTRTGNDDEIHINLGE